MSRDRLSASGFAHALNTLDELPERNRTVALSLLSEGTSGYSRISQELRIAMSAFSYAIGQYQQALSYASAPGLFRCPPVRRSIAARLRDLLLRRPAPTLQPAFPTPDAAWNTVLTAAHLFADQLAPLGEHRFARCTRRAGWGECGLVLHEDGECHSSLGHLDDPTTPSKES